jgi:hypothetical protein
MASKALPQINSMRLRLAALAESKLCATLGCYEAARRFPLPHIRLVIDDLGAFDRARLEYFGLWRRYTRPRDSESACRNRWARRGGWFVS